MGPILTFDKSFLQMLSPEEVDELDLQFKIFVTPVLVSEILADLKHPSPQTGRLPEQMVRALARKMVSNHGIMQAHFRMLALRELSGRMQVPMVGSILVDSMAPNVMTSRDGQGVIYDSRQDRGMWGAWAAGNFTKADEYFAERWREHAGQIDIAGIAESWSDFCAKHLPDVRNIADVIGRIDELICRQSEQRNLLDMVFQFLQAPPPIRGFCTALMVAGLIPSLRA